MSAPSVPPWFVCLALAACTAAPPPLVAPTTALHVSYSRLAGAGDAASPATARTLAVAAFVCRAPVVGPPLDRAIVALAADGDAPFRGITPLAATSVWLPAEDAAAWQAAPRSPDECLPIVAGSATVGDTFWTRLALAGVQPVVLARIDGNGIALQFAARDAAGNEVRAILRHALPADQSGVLFVPDAALPPAAGIVLVLHDAGAAAAADLAAADAASQAPPPQPPDALQAQRGLALAAIGGDNRRTALLALAERHRLARCVDLLLCADEPQLIAMTERVAQNAPADAPDFAWRFERALWRALVPALQRDELPPGLASALLRHLGALGSDPTTLETVLGGSGDADAFLGALRQENLLALEDRDPAVRVHAHDWLAANGAAVPDYEPMAPRAERRRALRKFAAAAANAPTEGR